MPVGSKTPVIKQHPMQRPQLRPPLRPSWGRRHGWVARIPAPGADRRAGWGRAPI